jgi:hypothetical protein
MYKAVLMSVGETIYEGMDQLQAILKAQFSGSEAIVYAPDGGTMIYNPESGWRQL